MGVGGWKVDVGVWMGGWIGCGCGCMWMGG